jgi:hypothetical protein
MKLIYAAVFALFPLVAPAQTFEDSSMLAAVCNDDHCNDSVGEDVDVSASEDLDIEAILEKHSAIVTRDTDDDLLFSDPEDMPVGSTPQTGTTPAEQAILTLPDDDDLENEPAGGGDLIASQITAPEPQLETIADIDDVATTGPVAKPIPAVAALHLSTMISPENDGCGSWERKSSAPVTCRAFQAPHARAPRTEDVDDSPEDEGPKLVAPRAEGVRPQPILRGVAVPPYEPGGGTTGPRRDSLAGRATRLVIGVVTGGAGGRWTQVVVVTLPRT